MGAESNEQLKGRGPKPMREPSKLIIMGRVKPAMKIGEGGGGEFVSKIDAGRI